MADVLAIAGALDHLVAQFVGCRGTGKGVDGTDGSAIRRDRSCRFLSQRPLNGGAGLDRGLAVLARRFSISVKITEVPILWGFLAFSPSRK